MNEERLLDFNTVVKRYSFKPWGLRWLIRTRKIPIVRIGTGRGKIYFDPQDLEKWIESHKIEPIENGGKQK